MVFGPANHRHRNRRKSVLCGCSSTVEHNIANVETWVRLPSFAPVKTKSKLVPKKDLLGLAKRLALYRKQLLARHEANPQASPPVFLLNSAITELEFLGK